MVSLASNIAFLRGLAFGRSTTRQMGLAESPLAEVDFTGPNPGELRMFAYVPEGLEKRAPLLVALHGCTQTATSYDAGTGWCELARRYGFAVLMPEQRRSNNGNNCYNWFSRDDVTRGTGEAASIRRMVAQMIDTHELDASRVYVTGLSAGGAMAVSLLATYPDVFAAGAVIAGLAHGAGETLQEALAAMYRGSGRTDGELGNAVRSAAPDGQMKWPRISVWHGESDRTVNPVNGDEIVTQWLQLHGFDDKPMAEMDVEGAQRRVWWDADGRTIVESYRIAELAHGTPIAKGADNVSYGLRGPHVFPSTISSTWHIADFFGLVSTSAQNVYSAVDFPVRRARLKRMLRTS